MRQREQQHVRTAQAAHTVQREQVNVRHVQRRASTGRAQVVRPVRKDINVPETAREASARRDMRQQRAQAVAASAEQTHTVRQEQRVVRHVQTAHTVQQAQVNVRHVRQQVNTGPVQVVQPVRKVINVPETAREASARRDTRQQQDQAVVASAERTHTVRQEQQVVRHVQAARIVRQAQVNVRHVRQPASIGTAQVVQPVRKDINVPETDREVSARRDMRQRQDQAVAASAEQTHTVRPEQRVVRHAQADRIVQQAQVNV